MNMINELFKLKPGAHKTIRVNDGVMEGCRRCGENENPYLSARRTWNDHMREVIASRTMWQMLALLCLLIALAGVGGVIAIGSQSKFIPYVVQVNKLGEAIAVSRADIAAVADQRVGRSRYRGEMLPINLIQGHNSSSPPQGIFCTLA